MKTKILLLIPVGLLVAGLALEPQETPSYNQVGVASSTNSGALGQGVYPHANQGGWVAGNPNTHPVGTHGGGKSSYSSQTPYLTVSSIKDTNRSQSTDAPETSFYWLVPEGTTSAQLTAIDLCHNRWDSVPGNADKYYTTVEVIGAPGEITNKESLYKNHPHAQCDRLAGKSTLTEFTKDFKSTQTFNLSQATKKESSIWLTNENQAFDMYEIIVKANGASGSNYYSQFKLETNRGFISAKGLTVNNQQRRYSKDAVGLSNVVPWSFDRRSDYGNGAWHLYSFYLDTALPCNAASSQQKAKIGIFDHDYILNYTDVARLTTPLPPTVKVYSKNRTDATFDMTQTPTILTFDYDGAKIKNSQKVLNGFDENMWDVEEHTFKKDKVYRLEFTNLHWLSYIQVAIPYPQYYAQLDCSPQLEVRQLADNYFLDETQEHHKSKHDLSQITARYQYDKNLDWYFDRDQDDCNNGASSSASSSNKIYQTPSDLKTGKYQCLDLKDGSTVSKSASPLIWDIRVQADDVQQIFIPDLYGRETYDSSKNSANDSNIRGLSDASLSWRYVIQDTEDCPLNVQGGQAIMSLNTKTAYKNSIPAGSSGIDISKDRGKYLCLISESSNPTTVIYHNKGFYISDNKLPELHLRVTCQGIEITKLVFKDKKGETTTHIQIGWKNDSISNLASPFGANQKYAMVPDGGTPIEIANSTQMDNHIKKYGGQTIEIRYHGRYISGKNTMKAPKKAGKTVVLPMPAKERSYETVHIAGVVDKGSGHLEIPKQDHCQSTDPTLIGGCSLSLINTTGKTIDVEIDPASPIVSSKMTSAKPLTNADTWTVVAKTNTPNLTTVSIVYRWRQTGTSTWKQVTQSLDFECCPCDPTSPNYSQASEDSTKRKDLNKDVDFDYPTATSDPGASSSSLAYGGTEDYYTGQRHAQPAKTVTLSDFKIVDIKCGTGPLADSFFTRTGVAHETTLTLVGKNTFSKLVDKDGWLSGDRSGTGWSATFSVKLEITDTPLRTGAKINGNSATDDTLSAINHGQIRKYSWQPDWKLSATQTHTYNYKQNHTKTSHWNYTITKTYSTSGSPGQAAPSSSTTSGTATNTLGKYLPTSISSQAGSSTYFSDYQYYPPVSAKYDQHGNLISPYQPGYSTGGTITETVKVNRTFVKETKSERNQSRTDTEISSTEGNIICCTYVLIAAPPTCTIRHRIFSGQDEESVVGESGQTPVWKVGAPDSRTQLLMTNTNPFKLSHTESQLNWKARPDTTFTNGLTQTNYVSVSNQAQAQSKGIKAAADQGRGLPAITPHGEAIFTEIETQLDYPGRYITKWDSFGWKSNASNSGAAWAGGEYVWNVGDGNKANKSQKVTCREFNTYIYALPPKCEVRYHLFEAGHDQSQYIVTLYNPNLVDLEVITTSYSDLDRYQVPNANVSISISALASNKKTIPARSAGSNGKLEIKTAKHTYDEPGLMHYDWQIEVGRGIERWHTTQGSSKALFAGNQTQTINQHNPSNNHAGYARLTNDQLASGCRPLNDKDKIRVAYLPYYKAYYSGIAAGGYFGIGKKPDACEGGNSVIPLPTGQSKLSGQVAGYSINSGTDTSPVWKGASAQYIIRTIEDSITSVYSAALRATNPQPQDGLHLTGYMASTGRCLPNLWRGTDKLDADKTKTGLDLVNVADNDRLYYAHTQKKFDLTDTRQPDTNRDLKASLFFKGDLTIKSDIINNQSLAWSNPGDIGYLYIIAKGNIYIDSGVSRLDAILVSIPNDDGTKGQVYTCHYAGYPTTKLSSTTDKYDPSHWEKCAKQLVVNGAIIANKITLGRTFGTRIQAQDLEPSQITPVTDCPGSSCAAEIINLLPEYYAGIPELIPVSIRVHNVDYRGYLPINY